MSDERLHVTINGVFQDNNIAELHPDVTAAHRQAIWRARHLEARHRAVQFARLLIARGGKEELMGARLLALAYGLHLRDLGYPSTFDHRYRQRQRNRRKRR